MNLNEKHRNRIAFKEDAKENHVTSIHTDAQREKQQILVTTALKQGRKVQFSPVMFLPIKLL